MAVALPPTTGRFDSQDSLLDDNSLYQNGAMMVTEAPLIHFRVVEIRHSTRSRRISRTLSRISRSSD